VRTFTALVLIVGRWTLILGVVELTYNIE